MPARKFGGAQQAVGGFAATNAQRINTGDQLFVEFLAKLADDVINSVDANVKVFKRLSLCVV
jgi:hypothetical protein